MNSESQERSSKSQMEHNSFPAPNSLFGPTGSATQAEGQASMPPGKDTSSELHETQDISTNLEDLSEIQQEHTTEEEGDDPNNHVSSSLAWQNPEDEWDGDDIYNDDRYTTGADHTYALREGIDRETFRGSGFQDADESGTYDPNYKSPPRKHNRQQGKKYKTPIVIADDDDDDDNNDDEKNENKPTLKRKRLDTLREPQKPATQRGVLKFGELVENLKKRPRTEGKVFQDEEEEQETTPDNVEEHEFTPDNAEEHELDLDDAEEHELDLDNAEEHELDLDDAEGMEPDAPSVDSQKRGRARPSTFNVYSEDFSTVPDTSKCFQCVGEESCSLQTNPNKLPCDACEKLDRDCTKPQFTWKYPCAGCRNLKQHCSYAYNGGEDGKDCEQCQTSGTFCEPSSTPEEEEFTSIKMKAAQDDDDDESDSEELIRQYIAMSQSRRRPLRLKVSSTRNTSASKSMQKKEAGNVVKIDTAFSHPIALNHLNAEGYDPCHFCNGHDGVQYGLFGLGERSVEVLQPNDPTKGYTEVNGGHAGEGAEPTRMCIECTSQRLQIINCFPHAFRELKGHGTATTFDAGSSSDQFDAWKPWCSICITPAVVECCALQLRHYGAGEGIQGCGLYLCEECTRMMTTILVNDQNKIREGCTLEPVMHLDDLISLATQDLQIGYHQGLRADASLLSTQGELMRRIGAGVLEMATDEEKVHSFFDDAMLM